MNTPQSFPPLPLPPGITSRLVDTSPYSLKFHILEAGYSNDQSRPLILLLHGFPEIAFSWRRVMPILSSAGYYVVAPDLRGFGRTTGIDNRSYSEVNLKDDFSLLNLINDMLVLVNGLGYEKVTCLVGHDFGAVAASLCALTRPDFFQNLVLLSHPFKGPMITPPFNTANTTPPSPPSSSTPDIQTQLSHLTPPRKHYKYYYSSPSAASDLLHPVSSLPNLLRGYFHLKSGDNPLNTPHPLPSFTASSLQEIPTYYIMPLSLSMRETVSLATQDSPPPNTPPPWLTDEDLAIYTSEYTRTGFQSPLNWYRVLTSPSTTQHPQTLSLIFSSRPKITVPTIYLAGSRDWGTFQEPGALENMQQGVSCSEFKGMTLIEGAGHWVVMERAEETAGCILGFIRDGTVS